MQPLRGMSAFTAKWGGRIGKSGYSMIPNHLIWINEYIEENYRLTPPEFMVLLAIISTWHRNDIPAVSKSIISRRCGISERHVQRIITSLEKKKYLKRWYVGRRAGGANGFLLDGVTSHIERAITEHYRQRDLRAKELGMVQVWDDELDRFVWIKDNRTDPDGNVESDTGEWPPF